jgi:CheY-like chemotaxis protein
MSTASKHTILIVEDQPPMRGAIADVLRSKDCDVVEVWNGQQAMSALDEHRQPGSTLCLVLLDLMMPGVDGFQVLRHLAGLGSYVPVVAMSAYPEGLIDARAAGACATLRKPFDVDELLATIQKHCAHQHV